MTPLKAILIKKLEGAARVAILGIGSDLRGDDAAGLFVAQKLEECLGRVFHVNHPLRGGEPKKRCKLCQQDSLTPPILPLERGGVRWGHEIQELASAFLHKSKEHLREGLCVKIFHGGTAPENCTGEIKRFQPTHLIIVDTADMGQKAGAIKLFTPEEAGGVSFSTHQLPIGVMVDYLAQSLKFETVIIGIQPADLSFGKAMSRKVRESVNRLILAVEQVLMTRPKG